LPIVGKEYDDTLSKYDVFITPTLSRTAPRNGDREASALEKTEAEKGLATNTAQFNLTGHPAMTLPIGFLPDMSGLDSNVMLPVGMQIVGPLHGENKIFKVGYAYEKMFGKNTKA
jgi:amidase